MRTLLRAILAQNQAKILRQSLPFNEAGSVQLEFSGFGSKTVPNRRARRTRAPSDWRWPDQARLPSTTPPTGLSNNRTAGTSYSRPVEIAPEAAADLASVRRRPIQTRAGPSRGGLVAVRPGAWHCIQAGSDLHTSKGLGIEWYRPGKDYTTPIKFLSCQ